MPASIPSHPYNLELGLSRIHIDNPYAQELFSLALLRYLSQYHRRERELVIVCIGTDRSTGDALGPLIGSKLNLAQEQAFVYGTLEQPVHAGNLAETMSKIQRKHPVSTCIAIDACLGKTESVGHVSIKEGPLKPGTGVNKTLPSVGDLHIIGVVNVGGFMEYFVLQNTRLSLVMKMANLIVASLEWAITNFHASAGMAPAPVAAECAYTQELSSRDLLLPAATRLSCQEAQ